MGAETIMVTTTIITDTTIIIMGMPTMGFAIATTMAVMEHVTTTATATTIHTIHSINTTRIAIITATKATIRTIREGVLRPEIAVTHLVIPTSICGINKSVMEEREPRTRGVFLKYRAILCYTM